MKKAKLIAFYLPQFHPVPENDKWWGKGFTEWTNVAKAKPLFRGHEQPIIPADLGFYDLRVPETRIAQAELAREHGIEGFCYWHYWFSEKRLLERPFNEVLKSGKPDYPFCLGWANHTWSGIWMGSPDYILIKQEYPGIKDYENHFYTVLNSFMDDRYIAVDGKPLFLVFHPTEMPEPKQFTDLWRNLATKSGLKGIYFIGIAPYNWIPSEFGYDASCVDSFSAVYHHLTNHRATLGKIIKKKLGKTFRDFFPKPAVYSYKDIVKYAFYHIEYNVNQYPCIIPNFDNTPRSKYNGVVFKDSSPELFRQHLLKALELIQNRPMEKRILFIKSWNEWAEGNYIEPDQKFGKAYLEVIKNEILN